MLRTTSIITSLTTLTVVVSLTPIPCQAIVHGDVELLKAVALRHKANLESLLTWKGEAFEERISTRGDSYDYMLRSNCIFAYDQLKDAVRWNREPQENRFVTNGETQRDINANYNSAMIKGQTSYDYKGAGLKDDKVTYHLIIGEPERVIDFSNHGLDPRYFFANCRSIPIYDKLMHMYNNANNPKISEMNVKLAGDLVILTGDATVRNQPITEKYVFDLLVGGNIVEFYNKGPGYENHREYEYEEKSGVWVLKSFKKMNITHNEKGDRRSTRSIKWSNSVVNVPFEEDEFTLEKLGLKPGDYVHDHKVGMLYKYKGALHDSEMLDVLETAGVTEVAIIPENGVVSEEVNEAKTVAKREATNETNTVAERPMLQTSETNRTHTYIYIIIIAIVIGLAGIAYKLTCRFKKE